MASSNAPVEVFCSYAHRDERILVRLEKQLSASSRQGLITLWHNRQILAGTDWQDAIDAHLTSASIILLLISPDFLASDYCYGVEMQRALQRHAEGQALVIPVLVRPVDWYDTPFAKLQALPTNAQPITSWKDQDQAFADVAAGIRRAIEDRKASAPHAALPPIWNVPYLRNPMFTGHEQLLERIADALKAEQTTALSQAQAISGLGGIGKTQIALEYAYRHAREYQFVLWTLADTRESLISGYIAIAELLNLPEKDAQDQAITIGAVKTWLQGHNLWLLILDNADDLALVREFIPTVYGGHILLTTRAQSMGQLAKRIEVETMTQDVGALFLLRRAGLVTKNALLNAVRSSEQILARWICNELGGLPLALAQAGAYIEETRCSLSEYQKLYQHYRADLLNRRGGQGYDHPEPVATTWTLSFEKVEQQNPAAADLLRMCAFLASSAIPEELLIKGAHYLGGKLWPVATDPFEFAQVIAALRAYSLLTHDSVDGTLTVHRLIQTVVRDALLSSESDLWKQRAVLALDAAFPEVEFDIWSTCERLLPHALLCADWIDQLQIPTLQAAHLLNQVGLFLKGRARYAESQLLYQRSLSMYEQLVGPIHPDTATSLNNLALLYAEQGKYAEARPLLQRALAIREQQLGADHPSTAASLDNLANLYMNEEKYVEAEPLFLRALAIREQQLGEMHPSTAISLNNLALLYVEQEKYAQAEQLYQRALAIHEQQLGPEHPSTAASLDNLANLYVNEGKYTEAEQLYQRALAIHEQQLGPEHPDTATGLNNLALLYAEQGKYAQAEPLYQRALTIYERVSGPEHPHTQKVRRNYERLSQKGEQPGVPKRNSASSQSRQAGG